MKRIIVLLLASVSLFSCGRKSSGILVYAPHVTGARHNQGSMLKSLTDLGKDNGFSVAATDSTAAFNDDTLGKYAAVLFLDADGTRLPFAARVALKRYMEAGGGFIRVGEDGHSDYDWAWYRMLIGGYSPYNQRVFCTPSGEGDGSYTDEGFIKHLLKGIRDVTASSGYIDYTKARTAYPPAEGHFTKVPLVQGQMFEPTEMTVLPDLSVLFLQRRGQIMFYNAATHGLKEAGYLDVYWKTARPGVNAEEGMLGICKDPDFSHNHWVYIYYSPVDTAVNRLSRFEFTNDTILRSSEKVVMEVHAQRDICCHTGGSITFDKDGLLYVSTGDNSTPFDEPGQVFVNHGFAPLNDLPGHQQYDARRSAGNTNDLRGKILRIRVLPNGSYEIPGGNLFAPGTAGTRPEIYVMGDRNPYRISVDQKNGYLYWGEIGPDAGTDSLDSRGPRGYDEINQARKAGNFGWPLFVGDNYAYHAYDYVTGRSGPAFNQLRPENLSLNNTGLKTLPPAQPAFIWYPYATSPEFPETGTGGRSSMAGPVYYPDLYPAATRYPDYYSGKLFIYEWMRGWIKAVTLAPNGDLEEMEPFLPGTALHNCIDMEVGSDGRLYLLEYGTAWFAKNADAGLYRIDYDTAVKTTPAAAVTTPVSSASPASVDSSKHAVPLIISEGRALVQGLDCKSCHQESTKSIGPSFEMVSLKYAGKKGSEEYLSQKVIKGGSGVWGDVAMSAHPDISRTDLHKIIQYVLALKPQKK